VVLLVVMLGASVRFRAMSLGRGASLGTIASALGARYWRAGKVLWPFKTLGTLGLRVLSLGPFEILRTLSLWSFELALGLSPLYLRTHKLWPHRFRTRRFWPVCELV
jgi:hypothetical protein